MKAAAGHEALVSRVAAIESNYARREELAELETRILKWVVATALTTGAVVAAIAASIVSLIFRVIG